MEFSIVVMWFSIEAQNLQYKTSDYNVLKWPRVKGLRVTHTNTNKLYAA